MVEDIPFCDVINLYVDVIKMKRREKKQNDPNRIIRKPAGDNWV